MRLPARFRRVLRRRTVWRRAIQVDSELAHARVALPPPPPSPPPPPPVEPPPTVPPLQLQALDDGIRRSACEHSLPSCDLPHSFVCPITGGTMHDPVILTDGFSYERDAIVRWLDGHQTSPCTGMRLDVVLILPNHTLREAIREVCCGAAAREEPRGHRH